MSRYFRAFLPALILLTTSCAPAVVVWPKLNADDAPAPPNPPPEVLRFVSEDDEDAFDADFIVSIETLLTPRRPEYAFSRHYLVPVLPWLDSRRSVSLGHVGSGVFGSASESAEPVFQRLEDVALPYKMAALDGLYPGDEDYPLTVWSVLTVAAKDGEVSARHTRLMGKLENTAAAAAAESLEKHIQMNPVPRFYHLAGVGDIMPGRGFDDMIFGENGIEKTLGDVAPLLEAPDLLIGNLEAAVTVSNNATPKSYNFKVAPDVPAALVDVGFDFFHLANNHGWDYGEEGFLDTLSAVRRSGAGFSGAGENLEQARFAWETKTPEGSMVRILSLGACFAERNGFNGALSAAAGENKPGVLWDSPENEEFIRSVLGRSDAFTVVTVHGGYEWESVPREDVTRLYRRYVDWGADLVLAHHPHVLQGMELYDGALIAYSLGNFIFPGMKGWYSGEETGILDIRLHDGCLVGLDFFPVGIDDVILRRAEDSDIAEGFWMMSRELSGGVGPSEF
ncbi:MAG: CapA family protein [Spirochaetaceae bacterium]|nr:CapA family protein [Spirochaetaceae bacterium]